MFEQRYHELYLPNVNNTTVPMRISPEISGLSAEVVMTLEVWDKEWFLLENESITISDKSSKLRSVTLCNGLVIQATLREAKKVFTISVSETNEGNILFDKYLIDQKSITIGSSQNCTINYKEKFISPEHAVITSAGNGIYTVKDLNSVNGTFLNGKIISDTKTLQYGDVIYVIGLKIVFLGNLIALNNPQHHCLIHTLKPIQMTDDVLKNENIQKVKDIFYLRTPRPLKQLTSGTIEIEGCPAPNKQKKQPMLFTIGPAFTMIIPMAMGAALSSGSGLGAAGLSMSIGAAGVGTFWALINVNYTKKEEKKENDQRIQQYQHYLSQVIAEIEHKNKWNRETLEHHYPSTEKNAGWVFEGNRRLWERSATHHDFLNVRVGTGTIPSLHQLVFPKVNPMSNVEDYSGEYNKIREAQSFLQNVPITLSLMDNQLVGVVSSSREKALNIARVLSVQVAASHAYTDVKMGFVYSAEEAQEWAFAKWLPHVWFPDGKQRFIANDAQGVGDVCYYLQGVIRERIEKEKRNDKLMPLPHYLLFVGAPELLLGETIEKYIYAPEKEMGITTILFASSVDQLPSNCTTIIMDGAKQSGIYSLNNTIEERKKVQFDQFMLKPLESFSRQLSNIRIRETNTSKLLPDTLTFLDMYKTSRVEDLDIFRKWLKNRTYESMKSLIGHKGGDMPLYLDIHEKYHGPHGLVAGTTGSGKSETLQTYILSLAVNYHPNEISFILIDYKGGGMAASFDGLPHLAGIITNLGGNQTNRALASINSEIRRRQSVFSDYKVKHIDTYIELFRNGKAHEPMPHLLIIADEFAELKKEQPEFVRALVSAARVGRSLGVHLILATQKPSGVVDDEIWGNTRFRLCLRVADKQDSNEMIKRPDAAFITGSGRAYFQVGHDEIFEAFQSGWSGAKYEPEIPYSDEKNSKVEMIHLNGKPSVIKTKKKESSSASSQKKITQLEAIVAYAANLAKEKKIEPMRQIWLPPLPKMIYLEEIEGFVRERWLKEGWGEGAWHLSPIIGLADDPVHQSQFPVNIDFLSEGHVLVCGSIGSGKTTLLQTMIYSMVQMYGPDWVNIYIIDFNSRTMGIFKELPHVGEIAFEGEDEKIEQMMMMIKKELARRKQQLSEKNIGSFKEYVRLYRDIQAIVMVVDNFVAFAEAYEVYEELFVQLTREAASYGIYIVLSCNNANNIRMKIRQNIAYGIGLQLGDRFEYEDTIGERTEVVAEAKTPGRGILKAPKPLEFQTARCVKAEDVVQINQLLKVEFDRIKSLSTTSAARAMVEIVKEISYDAFVQRADVKALGDKELGVGLEPQENQVYAIDLTKTFCYIIGGAGKTGKTNMLQVIAKQAQTKGALIYIFDGMDRPLERFAGEIKARGYMTEADELFQFMQENLVNAFKERNRIVTFAREQGADIEEALKDYPRMMIFINDMTAFCNAIYRSDKDMGGFMELALEKGLNHKIYFFAAITKNDYDEFLVYTTIRNFISYHQGIHLGGLFDQQNILDFEMTESDRTRKLAPGNGYLEVERQMKKVLIPWMGL